MALSVLTAAYLIVSGCAARGLLRRVGLGRSRNFQRLFYSTLLAGGLLRASNWVMHLVDVLGGGSLPHPVVFAVGDLAAWAFLSDYLLLLYRVLEMVQATDADGGLRSAADMAPLRRVLVAINLAIYVSVAVLYTLNFFSDPKGGAVSPMERAVLIYGAGVYLIIGTAYMALGSRFVYNLHRMNWMGAIRSETMSKVGFLTAAVSFTFSCRAVFDLVAAMSKDMENLDWNWFVVSAYYLLLDVVPILLILYIFQARPRPSSAGPSKTASTSAPTTTTTTTPPLIHHRTRSSNPHPRAPRFATSSPSPSSPLLGSNRALFTSQSSLPAGRSPESINRPS